MKKISKIKFGVIVILGIILIISIVSFYNFTNLAIYRKGTNGDIVSQDGVVYHFNGELTRSYSDGELKADKVIGRFEGEDFISTWLFGPKVVKLKDYDGKDTFLLSGMMLQEVYN